MVDEWALIADTGGWAFIDLNKPELRKFKGYSKLKMVITLPANDDLGILNPRKVSFAVTREDIDEFVHTPSYRNKNMNFARICWNTQINYEEIKVLFWSLTRFCLDYYIFRNSNLVEQARIAVYMPSSEIIE